MADNSVLLSSTDKLSREQLALVPPPQSTATHKVLPHHEVIGALVQTLGFRHIGIHREEYAVSRDGMKFYGVLDLETTFHGCRFSIGIRNSHDKTMRLSLRSSGRDAKGKYSCASDDKKRKPGGRTPTTVFATPATWTCLPNTSGSALNFRRQ